MRDSFIAAGNIEEAKTHKLALRQKDNSCHSECSEESQE